MDASQKNAVLRHDRMVPRYTSYPTAPHFQPGVSESWYRSALQSITKGSPISLYVHVPFCPKLCWFCGCNTRITNRYNPVEEYLGLLLNELDMLLPHLAGRGLTISHLHFGGGSPTMLKPAHFSKFMDSVLANFTLSQDAEVAIEIDPRNIDKEKVRAYALNGINRVSFGIQDFDEKVLAAINRPQSFELDRQALQMCRDAGIPAVNLDLMYGLPHQTVETMEACAEQALNLDPDRIALFGYAHVPWMKKHMRLIPEDALPSPSQRLDLFEAAAARFEQAGYVPIGIDHFAKPTDTLTLAHNAGRLQRNFQGYTTDIASALVGVGASAIGSVDGCYVQNLTFIPQYRERLDAGKLPVEKYCMPTPEDRLNAAIISRMMCDLRVNPGQVAKDLGRSDYDFSSAFLKLEPLVKDGLVRLSPDGTIDAEVRQAARLACACFDTHLAANAQKQHVTSS